MKTIKNTKCAVETCFKMFGSKWKSNIIRECHVHGICTFSDFKAGISEITDAALGLQIRAMVADGLLQKKDGGYQLTEKSLDLFPILDELNRLAIGRGFSENENMAQTPIDVAQDLMGSKWVSRIVYVLHYRNPCRFNALLQTIEGISHKILKEKLLKMEADGLILRVDHSDKSLWVEYYLTKEGEEVYRIIKSMTDFCVKYHLLCPDEI